MSRGRVLFADNDADFLRTWSEYLERAGYVVVPAHDVEQARRELDNGRVDLAIIDVRLEDDENETDDSGVRLAEEAARSVPKIILTKYRDFDRVRELLRLGPDGRPGALDVVFKDEMPGALMRALRNALGLREWLRATIDSTTERLSKDYEDARKQSQMNYRASLAAAILGTVVVFAGVMLTMGGRREIGVITALGGLVSETVSVLFFKRVDVANGRMDTYHTESLQAKHLEYLLAACNELSVNTREGCKERLIDKAAEQWFPHVAQPAHSPAEEPATV